MKKLLLITFLLISHVSFAQKFAVKGRVLDNTDAALPSATVLLLQAKDSTLVSFGSTNTQGDFELKNVAQGNFLVKVTFLGFSPLYRSISPPTESNVLELGTLKMQLLSKELNEVLVKGDVSPVVIKKDTIEFNAGSFKTQPNAAVEELLKKMPGVEIDSEGNVTVQGERVQRVTVDGKEFFGRDPKMATKNLPADAINKVQVFDKKSDQAMFSGIDDGQREKTINLELKEEKRNSAFGNVMAGAGTDERYQAKATLNKFEKGRQLSFLGMANNVNSQGFGFEEYMNFSGGAAQMAGGRPGGIMITNNNANGVPLNFGGRTNGLMHTQAAGINFNNQFSKKTEANGSYFFNNLNQNMSRTAERENFSQFGNFLSRDNNVQESANLNHRGNFSIDHKIDSLNSLKLTGNIGYNDMMQRQRGIAETYTPEGELSIDSETDSYSESKLYNLNANLLYRHRYQKPGRFFTANALVTANVNNSDGHFREETEFLAQPDRNRQRNQVNEQSSETQNYNITLSHTEPLGNRRYLETNYSYRMNLSESDREVFDNEGGNRILNRELSNRYKTDYLYHRAGLNYKMNREKYNLTLGSGVQQSNLNGEVWLRNEEDKRVIKRDFLNVLPTARFNYDFANNRRLDFNYETNVQEPTVRQLQPVPDISNPVNIYIGNPDLEPSYMHQVRLNYNSFDAGTLRSFFGSVNIMHTTNAIVSSQTVNQNFERVTRPVNVGYNTMLMGFANYSIPIKKYNSRFHFGSNVREQYGLNVLNEVESEVNVRSLSGNVRYTYQKENLDFSVRADLTGQRTKYEAGNAPDQFFLNKTYASEINYRFLKTFHVNAAFDYLVYDNEAANFNQTIPLLNVSLSKQFLKNNSGELKLSGVNMLDRDLGITQTANALYTERETLNSLGQYYMLSFTYTINKHLNPMGARRGGAIQIIR